MNTNKLHAQLARALAPLDANDVPVSVGAHRCVSHVGANNSMAAGEPERWAVIAEHGAVARRFRSSEVGLAGLAALCAANDVIRVFPAREVQASGRPLDVVDILSGMKSADDLTFCLIGMADIALQAHRTCEPAAFWDQLARDDCAEVSYGRVYRHDTAGPIIVHCKPFDHAVLDAIDFVFGELSKIDKQAVVYVDVDYVKAGNPFADLIDKKLTEYVRPGLVVVRSPALKLASDSGALCVEVQSGRCIDIEVSDRKESHAVAPLDMLIWYKNDTDLKLSIIDDLGAEAFYPYPSDEFPHTRAICLGNRLFQVTHAVSSNVAEYREVWVRCFSSVAAPSRASAESATWRLRLANVSQGSAKFNVREASARGVKFSDCPMLPDEATPSDGAILCTNMPHWTAEHLIKHLFVQLKKTPSLDLNAAKAGLLLAADEAEAA